MDADADDDADEYARRQRRVHHRFCLNFLFSRLTGNVCVSERAILAGRELHPATQPIARAGSKFRSERASPGQGGGRDSVLPTHFTLSCAEERHGRTPARQAASEAKSHCRRNK